MDQPELDDESLEHALTDLSRLNRFFRGTSLAISLLEKAIGEPTPHRPVRILDVGTGSCDIPLALLDWAETRGLDLQVTAVDFSHRSLQGAVRTRHARNGSLALVCADAFSLPFKPKSFSFVMCAQFLHHFTFQELRLLLQRFAELATDGILISDLERSHASLALTWLGTRLVSNSRVVHNDSLISIRRGFTADELSQACSDADIGSTIVRRHFPCRLSATTSLNADL